MENRKTEAGRFTERMAAVLLAGTVFAGSILTGCGMPDGAGVKSSSAGSSAADTEAPAETAEATASEEAWDAEYGMTESKPDTATGAGETLRYPGGDAAGNTETVQKNAEEYSRWEEKGFSPFPHFPRMWIRRLTATSAG